MDELNSQDFENSNDGAMLDYISCKLSRNPKSQLHVRLVISTVYFFTIFTFSGIAGDKSQVGTRIKGRLPIKGYLHRSFPYKAATKKFLSIQRNFPLPTLQK
jgi:hypothetical protein